MKMTVQAGWEQFKIIIPKDASNEQVRDLKLAFYAGASHLLGINYDLGHDSISENAGVAILENISKELEHFTKRLRT